MTKVHEGMTISRGHWLVIDWFTVDDNGNDIFVDQTATPKGSKIILPKNCVWA